MRNDRKENIMNSELFTQIVLAVITIVGALVSAYVIPFIKSKMTQADMQRLVEFVKIAVRCANQIFTPEQWEKKKEYVLNIVKEFIEANLKIKLTDEQINAIIEGIVNLIKKSDEAESTPVVM